MQTLKGHLQNKYGFQDISIEGAKSYYDLFNSIVLVILERPVGLTHALFNPLPRMPILGFSNSAANMKI